MGRTLLFLQPSILALAFAAGLPAADPPPVAHDASGIAWDVQVDEDGTRSLRVGCTPGRRYTVEQSADLVQWSPVRSWTGLAPGQVVAVDLFVGPPPVAGGGAPPPPASGPMPLTASLAVQPVDDGSTALCWWRGGSSSYVRILEPASGGSWGPPTLTTLHIMELDGWTVLLQSSDLLWRHSSLTLPPADPPLAPEDAAFHAVLLANRAAIAAAIQGIHDNQQAALEYARLHGAPPAPPTAGCFFRVREERGIDSDGDGLTDEQELALGLNIFFADTDGDGMDDRFEVIHGFNPHDDGDRWLDSDSDGRSNYSEYQDGTDPNNSDTDSDGVVDSLDAAPDDNSIDWKLGADSGYVWVQLPGYDAVQHGPPVAVNNQGQVLCTHAVWGAGAWSPLNPDGATYTLTDGEDAVPSSIEAAYAAAIDDSGRVLGWGELPDTVWGSDSRLVPVVWTSSSAIPAIVGIQPGSCADTVLETSSWPAALSPDGWICVTKFIEGAPGTNPVPTFQWHAPDAPFSAPMASVGPFPHARLWPNFLFGGVPAWTRTLPGGSWATWVTPVANGPDQPVLFRLALGSSGQLSVATEILPAATLGAVTLGQAPPPAFAPTQGYRSVVREPTGRVWIEHQPPGGGEGRVWKESSSLHGAAAINTIGTAIDGRNRAWTNGAWIQLDSFLPPGAKSDEEAVWTHGINGKGVILASIGGPEGPPNAADGVPGRPGLFVPMGVVATPVAAQSPENAGWLQGEADARPNVEMVADSATLEGDELVVTLSGSVTDPISGMAQQSETRVDQISFRWGGGELGGVSVVGVGRDPVAFRKEVRIPAGLPTAYIIRAETNANISGNIGWDEATVYVQITEHPQVLGVAPSLVRLSLAPDTNNTAPRTVTVWFEDRASNPQDGTVTESAAATGVFSGQATLGTSLRGASAKLALPAALSTTAADEFMGEVTVDVPGVGNRSLTVWFQETGAATGVFAPRQGGQIVTGQSLEVVGSALMESSQGGSQPHPFTFRFPKGGFVADGTEPELVVGGVAFALKPFAVGEAEFLFPVDPADETAPRQFLASRLPVPARMNVPGYSGGDVIEARLRIGTSEFVLPPVFVEQAPSPSGSGGQASCRGGFAPPFQSGPSLQLCDGTPSPWRQPGDKITITDLETAFLLLYGEKGQILLTAFRDVGGTIELGDYVGDLDVDFLFWGLARAPNIQIEEDDPKVNGMPYTPAIAANLLWQGLVRSMVDRHVFDAIPGDKQVYFAEGARQAIAQNACRTTVAATNIYLSGICMTNDGLDLVMTINDVADGHYVALAGALPFIPSGAFRGWRLLKFKNGADEVISTLDGVGLEAIQTFRRTDDLRTMGVMMGQHQFDECIRKVLTSNGGKIDVPTNRELLRRNMLAMGIEPTAEMVKKWGKVKRKDNWYSIAEAHHDFPFHQAKWFAEHGVDVNIPAFGRWVSSQDHCIWHTCAEENSTPSGTNGYQTKSTSEQGMGGITPLQKFLTCWQRQETVFL